MANFNFNVADAPLFSVTQHSLVSTDCASRISYKVNAAVGDLITFNLEGTAIRPVTWSIQSYTLGGVEYFDWIEVADKVLVFSTEFFINVVLENSGTPGVFNTCRLIVENATASRTIENESVRENDSSACSGVVGGGGTFDSLPDTPTNKTGKSLQLVRVSLDETELEYFELPVTSDQPLESFVLAGTSIGKWNDGDTVPAHATPNDRWKDAGTLQILPVFTPPTASILSTESTSTKHEVGTQLTMTLTAQFNENDGDGASAYQILRNGSALPIGNSTTILQTVLLSDTPVVFTSVVDYNAGTTPKPDNLDPPNSIPNTITAGVATSSPKSYKGYYPVFYGTADTESVDSASTRALDGKLLKDGGTSFEISTGTSRNIFKFFLPDNAVLVKAYHDNINDDITQKFVKHDLDIDDAGAGTISGDLYIYKVGTPFPVGQTLIITIA